MTTFSTGLSGADVTVDAAAPPLPPPPTEASQPATSQELGDFPWLNSTGSDAR